MLNSPTQHLRIAIVLLLVIATLSVFWQIQNNKFVNYDDETYITKNSHVRTGMRFENVTWAFASMYASNWHPLTWLSHMLDCQIYGLNPKGHHLNNLLLHIANTLLLFFVLNRMTGAFWRSIFVAALFALHPLHVESVAWAAERKDVLSTFFCMLTIWAYARYVELPCLNRYLPCLLFFALGLMSKAMLVTLPFVLLLLDYWPLRRFNFIMSPNSTIRQTPNRCASFSPFIPNPSIPRFENYTTQPIFSLLIEKVPFFVFSITSSIVTVLAQYSCGTIIALNSLPLKMRIANAFVSYVNYIAKMIWPFHLAVLYPYQGIPPLWHVFGSVLLLFAVTLLALKTLRLHSYFFVGWLWYLGTLFPVIGLVQTGAQTMADRYTYIPLVGLFIIIVWGLHFLFQGLRYHRILLCILGVLALFSIMICTWIQVKYWKNSITLFEHTLEITSNNQIAHQHLGTALGQEGRFAESAKHFLEALRINPGSANIHNNLAVSLAHQGKYEDVIEHYRQSLRIMPDSLITNINLGLMLSHQGRFAEAIRHYSKAIEINPDYSRAHFYLGLAYFSMGDKASALKEYNILRSANTNLADILSSKISKQETNKQTY